jgi:hypothetical protein
MYGRFLEVEANSLPDPKCIFSYLITSLRERTGLIHYTLGYSLYNNYSTWRIGYDAGSYTSEQHLANA